MAEKKRLKLASNESQPKPLVKLQESSDLAFAWLKGFLLEHSEYRFRKVSLQEMVGYY